MVSSRIGIHASENSLSTNRPISAAANEVVILTRVTNARLVLWAYYNCDTSTIRARFDYDSATTRYNTLRGFRALAYEIVYENQL